MTKSDDGEGGLLLARRLAPHPTSTPVPGWVCTVSHIGFDLVPLMLVAGVLCDGAFNTSRAIAGGLAAGTLGLLVGELGCERAVAHVLVYHVGAWLAAAALLTFVLARRTPRTFAP